MAAHSGYRARRPLKTPPPPRKWLFWATSPPGCTTPPVWRWGQPAEGRLPSLTTGRAPLSHTPHKPPPVSHHLLSRTRPHSHRPRSASRALHPSSHPLRRQSPRPQAAFNTGGVCVCKETGHGAMRPHRGATRATRSPQPPPPQDGAP